MQTITVGGNVPLILEWNQPYGGATSDLEMLAFQNGHLVGDAQSGAQSGQSVGRHGALAPALIKSRLKICPAPIRD